MKNLNCQGNVNYELQKKVDISQSTSNIKVYTWENF